MIVNLRFFAPRYSDELANLSMQSRNISKFFFFWFNYSIRTHIKERLYIHHFSHTNTSTYTHSTREGREQERDATQMSNAMRKQMWRKRRWIFFIFITFSPHLTQKHLLNSIRIFRAISILNVCNSLMNQLYFFIHLFFPFLLQKNVLF